MRKVVLFACLLLIISACAPAPTPAPTQTPRPTRTPAPTQTAGPSPTPAYPDLAISMMYDQTLMRCGPQVTIDAYGNVGYQQSSPYCQPLLVGRAKITPEQIEELVAAIHKANIWAIEDQPNPPLDGSPLTISVTLEGRSKRVTRYDVISSNCHDIPSWVTPGPGMLTLCELQQTIARITNSGTWDGPWMTVTPSPTPTLVASVAIVTVTVYTDQNGNGTPEPNEGQSGIPVELRLPDGKILSAKTQQGIATFDMSGYRAGAPITASLPSLYRSYQFYLPQAGTVPVVFAFVPPTPQGKVP